MNNKKLAFSTMGFAIVIVIILGIVMIASAPMMADKYKNKPVNQNVVDSKYQDEENNSNYEEETRYKERIAKEEMINRSVSTNNSYDFNQFENRIMEQVDYKIKSVMSSIPQQTSDPSISDKYVCSIEGYLDDNGNVVPINSDNNDVKVEQMKYSMGRKFVFVCQYNR